MKGTRLRRPLQLWLVEDNPADVRLIGRAVEELRLPLRLRALVDGAEALAVLRRTAANAPEQLPDLLLLDLNLPGMDGISLLTTLKAEAALGHIPAVVLTSTEDPREVRRSYQAHANAVLCKPHDFEQLLGLIGSLADFWFRHAELPSE